MHTLAQSCPTLCDSIDCCQLDPSVHGVLQVRILEWVAISSSRGSFRPRGWSQVSCVSCMGRWILYLCVTWEALLRWCALLNSLKPGQVWKTSCLPWGGGQGWCPDSAFFPTCSQADFQHMLTSHPQKLAFTTHQSVLRGSVMGWGGILG